MRKLAHIINPVAVDESSDLYIAQPITFETMKAAKEYAKGKIDVELFTAQYSEDRHMVPDGFIPTQDLKRSIKDLAYFKKSRKLPILKDILDRLYDTSDAEYLIYTNVDISLMPSFYVSVNALIEEGYDAFTINKRLISDKFKSIDEIPIMYAEAGKIHRGHDCFIFKRQVYPKYILGKVCIGAVGIGRTLLFNLSCHADRFALFSDKHLTFHIGNERKWKGSEYSDMLKFNQDEEAKALEELESKYGKIDRSIINKSKLKKRKKATLLQRLLYGEKYIQIDGE
ncbi:hypothetical protein KAR91_16665 [Candidatus Pacearchaeota archaeon]|nr:hypothetical protein [Candidatus Pacearchaeota archaeon]